MSSITLMELEFGIRTAAHLEFIEQLRQKYPVVPFGAGTAQVAGNIYRRLRQNHLAIDIRDLMMASVAMECDLPLATLNRAHFEKISDLQLFAL